MESLVDTPIPWNEAPERPTADGTVPPAQPAPRGSPRTRIAGGAIAALFLVAIVVVLIVAFAGDTRQPANRAQPAATAPVTTTPVATISPTPVEPTPAPTTPVPSAAPFQPCRTEISWWQDAAGIYHQMVIYHCDSPTN